MSEQDLKKNDSDDALTALESLHAAGDKAKDLSKEDALMAMASGEDVSTAELEREIDSADGSSDAVEHDGALPMADDGGQPGVPMPALMPVVGDPAKLRAAHAHGMKSFLVPPCLITGLLLWVMGALLAIMQIAGSLGPIQRNGGILNGPFRIVLIVLAFPLGAVLLGGAWLFHRELSQKK